jgi:hypothetical protein
VQGGYSRKSTLCDGNGAEITKATELESAAASYTAFNLRALREEEGVTVGKALRTDVV